MADWHTHFITANPIGRPDGEGWLTAQEMANEASVSHSVIDKYLRINEKEYEKAKGTFKSRKTTYYRFKGVGDRSKETW